MAIPDVLDAADSTCQTAPMSALFKNPVDFDFAVDLLQEGGVCAFPTETVYGLGADAGNADAVLQIYSTKKRPRFNPLIVHCADLEMAEKIARFSPRAQKLARLWPGALTLVLPVRAGAKICDLVTAGLGTVGVRVPAHPLAQDLIEAVGRPLAAPSANPSGQLSPTSAGQVRLSFDDRVPVLDGGQCAAGIESTILAVTDNGVMQLRSGALTREEIEKKLGILVKIAKRDSPISAPGMLKSHYAPRARLRLNASEVRPGEAFLGFGNMGGEAEVALNLSPTGYLPEAAKNLFSYLHRLDASGVETIAVAPVPDAGLGEAINDRLARAAAPR
jgi:L-threonylcarbamoyladenylate synthase